MYNNISDFFSSFLLLYVFEKSQTIQEEVNTKKERDREKETNTYTYHNNVFSILKKEARESLLIQVRFLV